MKHFLVMAEFIITAVIIRRVKTYIDHEHIEVRRAVDEQQRKYSRVGC